MHTSLVEVVLKKIVRATYSVFCVALISHGFKQIMEEVNLNLSASRVKFMRQTPNIICDFNGLECIGNIIVLPNPQTFT
jgi:hypothetical protein